MCVCVCVCMCEQVNTPGVFDPGGRDRGGRGLSKGRGLRTAE